MAAVIEKIMVFHWGPVTLRQLYICWSFLTGKSGEERVINVAKIQKSSGALSSPPGVGTVKPIVDRIMMRPLVTECRNIKQESGQPCARSAIASLNLLLEIPWNEPTIRMLNACKDFLSEDEYRQANGLRYIEENFNRSTFDEIRGFSIPPRDRGQGKPPSLHIRSATDDHDP